MAEAAKAPLSNLTQRIITGAVGGPLVVIVVLAGEIPFALLVTLVATVGVIEFYILARNRPSQGSAVIGTPMLVLLLATFYLSNPLAGLAVLVIGAAATFALETLRHHQDIKRSLFQVGTTLAGVFYVGVPSGLLIAMRALPNGLVWILLVLLLTWGTDSLAYIGGRLWGRTKLAPTISPHKTLEGALVGIVGGIIPSLLLLAYTQTLSLTAGVLVCAGPLVAILGDLFESWLKRFFQVKDSHLEGFDILPGHGGVLDRINSLLMVAVYAFIFLLITGLR